jgi:predicted RecA/RadA family phage recombinase
MRNFIQPGVNVTVTAPYALTSGQGCQVGDLFGVAVTDALISTPVEITTQGVFELNKLATDVVTAGAIIYWDNTNRRCTVTASTNRKIGQAVAAAGSGVGIVQVRLSNG